MMQGSSSHRLLWIIQRIRHCSFVSPCSRGNYLRTTVSKATRERNLKTSASTDVLESLNKRSIQPFKSQEELLKYHSPLKHLACVKESTQSRDSECWSSKPNAT